ncbi:Hypothetical_protein [Hexamita inflata]|uniref:Hypothetical_protein n=1 Tax=Hexamita inflata TaxID=28002 RepID=A0AA86PCP3_9EUKA|nr:Hypothetical protein HINF_LOCUS21459 [Hexamita inflata]
MIVQFINVSLAIVYVCTQYSLIYRKQNQLAICKSCLIDQIKQSLCLNPYIICMQTRITSVNLAYKLSRFKIVCFMSTFTTNSFCAAVHMSSVRRSTKLFSYVTTVYCCSRTVHRQLFDMLTVLSWFADQNELP